MILTLLMASAALADRCIAWDEGVYLPDAACGIQESSGLAASRTRDGVIFTLSDSGGPASLYAFDLDGTCLGEHAVSGARNWDWEDLSSGPCPDDGGPCLYIGDVGDNGESRDHVTIYVVREPAVGEPAELVATWDVAYPDGPHDSESILVHPLTGDLTIVTKHETGDAGVFRLPAERAAEGETLTLDLVTWLFFDANSSGGRTTTAADWSWDGGEVVIRSYTKLFHWLADPCEPDAHWDTEPTWWQTPSGPGDEAIAYLPDGDLVVSFEGDPMELARISCTDWVEDAEPCPEPEDTGAASDSGSSDTGTPPDLSEGDRACGCATPGTGAPLGWLALVLAIRLRRPPRQATQSNRGQQQSATGVRPLSLTL